jgi:3-oxoacyl-[acyl-carrier protein] reductase
MDAATAIVTGGGDGLGAAIARRLASDGFVVAVADVNGSAASERAAEINAGGGRASAFAVDVTDPVAVADMVDKIVATGPPLTTLVNNAGITGPYAALADYAIADWCEVVEVDLFGTLYCTKAALPALLAHAPSHIVNISSISGKEGNAKMTAYAAAKAGVIGLTKALGKELALTGVLVNAVAPAGISDTNISRDTTTTYETVPPMPMGRSAMPEEVAALVSWLCSPSCTFSTGAVFDISGGRAAY